MGTSTSMKACTICVVVFVVIVSLASADELKDLSSVDAPVGVETSVEKKAENSIKAEASLGEGVGWGGALMTSGSFTMSASTSAEEEELGEGVGWGGALMTSGSFTMSASTSA